MVVVLNCRGGPLIDRLDGQTISIGQWILDWIVYILGCADGTLYTGITNDLDRRMSEHESGQGAKYTKGRGPFQLIYSETCQGRGPASRRESQIKALNREQKLKLVSGLNGNSPTSTPYIYINTS